MTSFKEFLNEEAKDLGKYALKLGESLTYLYMADDEMVEALENYDMEDMEDKILFVFGVKQDMGLNVFDAVYAKKGYGPIAYKVAMTMMDSFAPVQDSRITKGAQRVWQNFFDGKGSKDVNKELFGVDATNWQRYNYSLKKKINYSKNLKEHEKLIGKDPFKEKIGMLDELADGLLINKMGAIY